MRVYPSVDPSPSEDHQVALLRLKLYVLCAAAVLICAASLLILFICTLILLRAV